jgi:hypothetical protein
MAVTIEKYQVAGLDEHDRGFNRMTDLDEIDDLYQATFRYERTIVRTDPCPSISEALQQLIGRLHERGYRQLRSRLSFRVQTYLGSQELWTEHPDPPELTGAHGKWRTVVSKLSEWFAGRSSME